MSQKEIQALSSLLGRMKTEGPKKKKKGGRSSGQPPSTPGTSGVVVTQRPRRSRGSSGVPASMGSEGAITLSRRELFSSITVAAGVAADVLPMVPSKAAFPWLANLTSAFERIVWHSMRFEWIPMVGTQTGGSIIFGVDWSYSLVKAKANRASIASLTPLVDTPLWQRAVMALNQGQLQSRKFYSLVSSDTYDNSPGQIVFAAGTDTSTSSTVGELWVTYRVSLSGTRPV